MFGLTYGSTVLPCASCVITKSPGLEIDPKFGFGYTLDVQYVFVYQSIIALSFDTALVPSPPTPLLSPPSRL